VRPPAKWLRPVLIAGIVLGCSPNNGNHRDRELREQELELARGRLTRDASPDNWLGRDYLQESDYIRGVTEFYSFPPDAWLASIGETIVFEGTPTAGHKGEPVNGVRVGEHLVALRGVYLRNLNQDARVRITGKLRCIQHPGQPGVGVQGQMGSTRPRKEYFVEASKLEILEPTSEVRQ
jgi:hypothetical protein